MLAGAGGGSSGVDMPGWGISDAEARAGILGAEDPHSTYRVHLLGHRRAFGFDLRGADGGAVDPALSHVLYQLHGHGLVYQRPLEHRRGGLERNVGDQHGFRHPHSLLPHHDPAGLHLPRHRHARTSADCSLRASWDWAAIPLWLLARRRLGGTWLPLAWAGALVMSAPIMGSFNFELHLLAWTVFGILMLLAALHARWNWLAGVMTLLLLFTKEDVQLTVFVIALYDFLILGNKKRGGVLIAAAGLFVLFTHGYWLPKHTPPTCRKPSSRSRFSGEGMSRRARSPCAPRGC